MNITEFLRNYSVPSTIKHYRIHLSKYLKVIHPEMDTVSASEYYLTEIQNERDYISDLIQIANLWKAEYQPATARNYIKTTMLWLQANEIPISYWQKRQIMNKIPKTNRTSYEMELTRKDIRNVYYALPEWPGIIVLMLASSGMRIGECMKIKKSDIDWNNTPVKIQLKAEYTKGHIPRIIMISQDAANELKIYLEKRTDSDERIFPYAKETFEYHWRKAVDTVGYNERDPVTGIREFHIHMLRKWFLSRFSLAASREIGEALAGHNGYLSNSYRRYTHKKMSKEYLKAEKKISVFPKGKTEYGMYSTVGHVEQPGEV